MKLYPTIQGPNKAPRLPGIAFEKYDGSNMRFEWSRKRGWYKFGTRKTMIDENDNQWGKAVMLFKANFSEELTKLLKTEKAFRGAEMATAFCEYYGPHSFAGWHDSSDLEQMNLTLFDVNIHKKGFVLPREFIKLFGHMKIPKMVYEGAFSEEFIKDIKNGKYVGELEGVVFKGVNQKTKSEQHGLWMAKCKTRWWMETLKIKMIDNPEIFGRAYEENKQEQMVSESCNQS